MTPLPKKRGIFLLISTLFVLAFISAAKVEHPPGDDPSLRKAVLYYEKARRLQPVFPDSALIYARKAFTQAASSHDTLYYATICLISDLYARLGKDDSALLVARKGYIAACDKNDKAAMGTMLDQLAATYEAFYYYENANECLLKHIELASALSQNAKACSLLIALGDNSLALAEYNDAMERYQGALKKAGESELNHYEAQALSKIGELMLVLNTPDQAIVYYERAYAIWALEKNTAQQVTILKSLAEIHIQKHNYAQAQEKAGSALELTSLNGSADEIVEIQNIMGRALAFQGKHTSALVFFKDALDLASRADNQLWIAKSCIGLGNVYLALKETSKALSHLNRAHAVSQTIKNHPVEAEALLALSWAHESNNNPTEALRLLHEYVVLSDSMASRVRTAEFVQADMIFKRSAMRSVVVEQDTTIRNMGMSMQRSRQNNVYLLMIVIGLILFIFYIVYNHRRNRIINAQLETMNSYSLSQTEVLWSHNERMKLKTEELRQANEVISRKSDMLDRLNKIKDRLISVISHDLRTPVINVKAFSVRLQSMYSDLADESRLRMLGHIANYSTSLAETLEELLNWAKSQRNTFDISFTDTNLHQLANEAHHQLSPDLQIKGIEFVNELDAQLLVPVDRDMIKTVIRNLVHNSVKFTPENGAIKAHNVLNDNVVHISIEDTGVGMNNNQLARLFIADQSHSTPGLNGERGRGIGLLICKDFVELHGGRIWAESQPGRGSKFIFTLPLSQNSNSEAG